MSDLDSSVLTLARAQAHGQCHRVQPSNLQEGVLAEADDCSVWWCVAQAGPGGRARGARLAHAQTKQLNRVRGHVRPCTSRPLLSSATMAAAAGPPPHGHMRPPPPVGPFHAQRKYSEPERWICIYPAYFNINKTRAEGRLLSKDKCVANPTYLEIREVLMAAENGWK